VLLNDVSIFRVHFLLLKTAPLVVYTHMLQINLPYLLKKFKRVASFMIREIFSLHKSTISCRGLFGASRREVFKIMNKLTPEQAEIFQFARSGHNLLITGQAGTGKSTLVNSIRHARLQPAQS